MVPLTEQQKATVKDDLAGVLKNKDCKDVVEALIAQAEKNTGFKAFSHNLRTHLVGSPALGATVSMTHPLEAKPDHLVG